MHRNYLSRKKILEAVAKDPEMLPDFDERKLFKDGYVLTLSDKICTARWIADMEYYKVEDMKNFYFSLPWSPERFFPYLGEPCVLFFRDRVVKKSLEVDVFPKFLNFFPLWEENRLTGMRGTFTFLTGLYVDMPVAIIKFRHDI